MIFIFIKIALDISSDKKKSREVKKLKFDKEKILSYNSV